MSRVRALAGLALSGGIVAAVWSVPVLLLAVLRKAL